MASKRNVRRRGCGQKIRHTEHWAARIHARKLSAHTGERFEPYQCGFCGHFHIGHAYRENHELSAWTNN